MRDETLQAHRERVTRVLVHIQEHLAEELDLPSLARIGSFSPYHFHRVFRTIVGEPVHQHIRRLRLERAALRLRRTSEPIGTIARRCGFAAVEAFCRAFRSQLGVSPSAFRQRHRPHPSRALARSRIEYLKPRRVAFMRHTGGYAGVGSRVEQLVTWAEQHRLLDDETEILGIPYDDPSITEPCRMRFDAAVTLRAPCSPCDEVGVRTLPGGPHAVLEHVGPYHRLRETFDHLYTALLPTYGMSPADVPPFIRYGLASDAREPPQSCWVHIPLEAGGLE